MIDAVLRPGDAARWVACPGSVAACRRYPERGASPRQVEGAAARWAWRELLDGRQIAAGLVTPAGGVLTDEMVEGAELLAEVVGTARQHVEELVSMSAIHPDCYGRPDIWHYDGGVVTVTRYAFGHRFVDAVENWPLIAYTRGVLDSLGINGIGDQHTRVVLRVVQPRSYHRDGPVRVWSVLASDLRPYWNQLANAAGTASVPDAPCVVTPECRDCSARHACTSLQRAAAGALDEASREPPLEMSPDALGVELRMLQRAAKVIEDRLSGLEESALSAIRAGRSVPGYRQTFGEGRTVWAKPVDEVVALGDMLGVSLRKPATLTPRQAIDAGVPEALVDAYSTRSAGKMKLERDDGSAARRIFGGGGKA